MSVFSLETVLASIVEVVRSVVFLFSEDNTIAELE